MRMHNEAHMMHIPQVPSAACRRRTANTQTYVRPQPGMHKGWAAASLEWVGQLRQQSNAPLAGHGAVVWATRASQRTFNASITDRVHCLEAK